AIEYRWVEGQWDRLPAMAADLVRRHVTVIASGGGTALAAKAATATIPIVFSLNRPEGNVTGVSSFVTPIASKRLDLLRQVAPSALIGVLANQNNPGSRSDLAEVERAAQVQAQQLLVLNAIPRLIEEPR